MLRDLASKWRGTRSSDKAEPEVFLRAFDRELLQASEEQRERLSQLAHTLREEGRFRGLAARSDHLEEYTVRADRPARLKPLPTAHDREIHAVEINNFKALDHLVLTLPPARNRTSGAPCLAILGENSTGKSTILAAVALALVGTEQARKLGLELGDLTSSAGTDRWDLLDPPPSDVAVNFHSSDHLARIAYDPTPDGDLDEISGTPAPSTVVLAYGPHRFYSKTQRDRRLGPHQRIRNLFDPTKFLSYPYDWLRQLEGETFNTVARTLRIVLALNDADELVDDPEEGMCVEANGRRTPIAWLSEGYRSVFGMVVDILRTLLEHYPTLEQARGVVLIDEIETHLHPRWKVRIMSSLRRALPGVQFIVTTHDPLCLRGMDDNEVVVLQRTGRGEIRKVENLPSISGMTAEQLLTSDYFGLSSSADPMLEKELAKTVDSIAVDATGRSVASPSVTTLDLVSGLTLGDSASEQVVQAALDKFLQRREEERTTTLRSDVREEAVEAVINALSATRPKRS